LKILVIVDEKPASAAALQAAADLARRLDAALGVLTVRHSTHATESTAAVGVEIPRQEWPQLPVGIRTLLKAAEGLSAFGLMAPLPGLKLSDLPHGHAFYGEKTTGERVLFSERFGSLIAEANHEIAESAYNLVVIAAPRRGTLGRFISTNIPRRMALDLHASFLVVRGGALTGRMLICADGSPSSRRIFPLLKKLLPALPGPADLLCVQVPDTGPEDVAKAAHCLEQAETWLRRCGREVRTLKRHSAKRLQAVLEAAGGSALVIMGESHHHDLRRRTVGTLPIKVLSRTDSSFLLVKQATEPDPEMFEDDSACRDPRA
jgi:nucleotide-binding universal stress UspA family protein